MKLHHFSGLSPGTSVSCSLTIGASVARLVAPWVLLVLVQPLTPEPVHRNKLLAKKPAPNSPLPLLVQYFAKP